MGLDPVDQPMVHRTDVQVRLAEAEGPFDHEQVAVFLDYPVIGKRAVGGVAFVSVRPRILGDASPDSVRKRL